MLSTADFMVVQDYYMTDTAMLADLVLPATYSFETGGSFTNTQRFLQRFEKQIESPVEKNNLEQLSSLLNLTGISSVPIPDAILDELFSLIQHKSDSELFVNTEGPSSPVQFMQGADGLKMKFCEYFKTEMGK
jgi:formate dehydrogenase major subunit